MRMREHMKNALAVAKALEANPRVTKVVHPGKIERITMKCQSAEMWNACKINNENKYHVCSSLIWSINEFIVNTCTLKSLI